MTKTTNNSNTGRSVFDFLSNFFEVNNALIITEEGVSALSRYFSEFDEEMTLDEILTLQRKKRQ